MKAILLTCVLAFSGLARSHAESTDAFRFAAGIGPGVNLGDSLDVPSGDETEWGNPPLSSEHVRACRRLGFRAVRVPVTWGASIDRRSPAFAIAPERMKRVREVVQWCLDEGMVTVLDLHYDSGKGGWPKAWLTLSPEHVADSERIFAAVWGQIAGAFRDVGERLVFQAFNELGDVRTATAADREAWQRFAAAFRDVVRGAGGANRDRYLIIPTLGARWEEAGSWRSPDPSDGRILAGVNLYEPEGFAVGHLSPEFDATAFDRRMAAVGDALRKGLVARGVPVVICETAAERQFRMANRCFPNEDARTRWAYATASFARRMGMPAFLWETGHNAKTGFISRRYGYALQPAFVRAFVGGLTGSVSEEEAGSMATSQLATPRNYVRLDCIRSWTVDDERCVDGVVLTADGDGNLRVRASDVPPQGLQLDLPAEQCALAVEMARAYLQSHGEKRLSGSSLVFLVTALNDTTVALGGEMKLPGDIPPVPIGEGADRARPIRASPEAPGVVAALPIRRGLIRPGDAGGLDVRLCFMRLPGDGLQPVDCLIGPVELR